ncbi:MAG: hypothetical protein IJS54_05525 [Desulfovibrio sp.]|nr:hypothetical protein [Desulfovibrio sp.]
MSQITDEHARQDGAVNEQPVEHVVEEEMSVSEEEGMGRKRRRIRHAIARPTREQDELIRRELRKATSEKRFTLLELMRMYDKELQDAKSQTTWDKIAEIFNKALGTTLTGDSCLRAYSAMSKGKTKGGDAD